MHRPATLTPYSPGSFRELSFLIIPLIFSNMSGILMNFCNRAFLGHYSLPALEGLSLALQLCLLFQVLCVRLTSTNHILIGNSLGSKKLECLGPYTWQMVWCAFGTMLITFPISLVLQNIYFADGEVGYLGKAYFFLMMKVNFLFPLGAALASFFLGLGKTKLIAIITLLSCLLNIGLDYLLIFGMFPLIPPLGVRGAAFATSIAQGFYCLFLLCLFLQRKYAETYLTRKWALNKRIFWESISLAVPRSLAKANILLSWVAATWILSLKGDLFVLILSIGTALSSLFIPINEAMGQALLSLFSFFHGKREWGYIWSTMKSAYLFLIVTCIIFSLPLVFFQKMTLSFFLKNTFDLETMNFLRLSSYWVWIYIFCNGAAYIPFSLITALGRTKFLLKVNAFSDWLACFFPIFLAFYVWHVSPHIMWLLCPLSSIFSGVIYYSKVRSLYKEETGTFPNQVYHDVTK